MGLILAFLNRADLTSLARYVFAGLGLAVDASVAGAAGASMVGIRTTSTRTEVESP